MKNKLARALRERQVTLGAWMQIGHPACAEIFARAGFDWVCVDLEHGAIGLETMTDIFRTLSGFDCAAVTRLPINDPVSSLMLDRYVESLDPSRSYFLASDIQDFERYRYRLDDAVSGGDLAPAFDIFARF